MNIRKEDAVTGVTAILITVTLMSYMFSTAAFTLLTYNRSLEEGDPINYWTFFWPLVFGLAPALVVFFILMLLVILVSESEQ